MALVITIIVLLILAGITIGMLTGDNGIINNAGNAKEQTEIANEKEIIDQATIEAMGRNKRGNLIEEEFQEAMDRNTKEGDTEVTDIGDQFEVYFKESNRYYMVDKNGSILDYEVAVTDPYPGDITKDENGNTLDGSEEHPFEINCIEDLVVFSIMSNEGNQELGIEANTFTNKYVVLKRTLNFKSGFSYKDATNTKYGDLNLDGTVEEIKTELTKTADSCVGFTPIKSFNGYFNGNNNEIQNIYINREGNAALMITGDAVKIENIGITGKITSISSGDAAGICMGAKTIENCYNKAEIKSKGYTAGISRTWYSSSNIKNCYNTGNITGGGTTGGISAVCGIIENCYNTGKIVTEGVHYAGGICAGTGNVTTTIKNCYNEGEVVGKKAGNVGGILGTNGEVIENCYNLADVTGTEYIGGIIGGSVKEVYNCYNSGNIIGGNRAGGIVGANGKIIQNCYNLGNAKGKHTGGIVGENREKDAIISNCFNIGTLSYYEYTGAAGGILGNNTSSITINNSYNIGRFENLDTWPKTKAGIIGREDGTSTLNKCYYLKTEEGIRSYRRGRRCRVGCNPINKYKRNNSRYIK